MYLCEKCYSSEVKLKNTAISFGRAICHSCKEMETCFKIPVEVLVKKNVTIN